MIKEELERLKNKFPHREIGEISDEGEHIYYAMKKERKPESAITYCYSRIVWDNPKSEETKDIEKLKALKDLDKYLTKMELLFRKFN